MRKFVLAALAVFALGTTAQAALILHVEDVTVTTSNSGPTTGFFEVFLEETGDTQALVATYNVGLRLQPTGVITFTGQSASVDNPSLFLGQTPTDRTAVALGYVAGNDRLLVDDFVINGNAANAPVENGTRDGLFRISFNIPQGAVGTFAVNIDPNELEIADADGNANELILDDGLITVLPVPEPSTLALGLLALPLLARRRR